MNRTSCLSLCVAVAAILASGIASAGDLIINLGSADFEVGVKDRARQIIAASGNGLGHNSMTDEGQDEQSLIAYFTASSDDTQLASFSDDQVTVYITDTTTGNGESSGLGGTVGQGAALEDLDHSLVELNYPFTAGHLYRVRVEYKNIKYTGNGDIDGVVLFAYNGGGSSTGTLSIRGIDTDTGEEFADGDYLHYNWGRRIRFTASGYSGSGDNLQWQTTSGGAFSTGSPVGPSVLWNQANDWLSSDPGDVRITVQDPSAMGSSSSASFSMTIFRIYSVDDEAGESPVRVQAPQPAQPPAQNKTLFTNSTKSFLVLDGDMIRDLDGIRKQYARLRTVPTEVTPNNPNYANGAIFAFDPVARTPIKEVIVTAEFQLANSQQGNPQLWLKLTSGSIARPVDVVWYFNVNGNVKSHEVYPVSVKDEDQSFGDVRFLPPAGGPVKWRTVNGVVSRYGRNGVVGFEPVPNIQSYYEPEFIIDTSRAVAAGQRDVKAREYEAGLIQNLVSVTRIGTYSDGSKVSYAVDPLPLRDGNKTDPDFVMQPQAFPRDRASVKITAIDIPNFGMYLNESRWGTQLPATLNSSATLTRLQLSDKFITWYAARHKPTGAMKRLHYIEWETDYLQEKIPVLGWRLTRAQIKVTTVNGAGPGPVPVLGGPIPGDTQTPVYTMP